MRLCFKIKKDTYFSVKFLFIVDCKIVVFENNAFFTKWILTLKISRAKPIHKPFSMQVIPKETWKHLN